jgi:hypothetical protein
MGALQGKKATDFVLAEANGQPPSRQRLYKVFVALQRRVGISPPGLSVTCDTRSAPARFAPVPETVRALMATTISDNGP